jgi:hypothetical protein
MINSEGAEMVKLAFGVIIGALIAVIVFFWLNPSRVGEITIATPNGPSMTFKVADSNEISKLIQKGLENENTANTLTDSLLGIIERLPPGSTLGEKLLELAERRRPPFSLNSVPVKLVYRPNLPGGLAGVCENSSFSAKNIVVFVLGGNDGELLHTFQAYADVELTFPCPAGDEILHINSTDAEEFNRHKVLAKRNL